jgi:hypothetical protein
MTRIAGGWDRKCPCLPSTFGVTGSGMKTHTPKPAGRVRLTRTFSLYPAHAALLEAEAQARRVGRASSHGLLSEIVQELIEEGLGGKASARFKRDGGTFAADCYDVLLKAGWSVEKAKTVAGHSVDLVATKAKRRCAVLLAERVREARLENSLATAMLLRVEGRMPVVVCTPYILDRAVAKAFEVAGSRLCDPATLAETVSKLAI